MKAAINAAPAPKPSIGAPQPSARPSPSGGAAGAGDAPPARHLHRPDDPVQSVAAHAHQYQQQVRAAGRPQSARDSAAERAVQSPAVARPLSARERDEQVLVHVPVPTSITGTQLLSRRWLSVLLKFYVITQT